MVFWLDIIISIIITKTKQTNIRYADASRGSSCRLVRSVNGRYFTGSPLSEPRSCGCRQAAAVDDTVWCHHPKAGLIYSCSRVRVADGNLFMDRGKSTEGKLPDEGRRPPPRHLLLEQGIHPHPGPMQVDATEGDEVDGFDPNTFLFLGSDPMHYGLSLHGMQGPSEFFAAGPSDTVNDNETSEEELIEDCSDNQPPTPFSITGGDDDEDDELGEDAGNRSSGFLDWYGDTTRHDHLCRGRREAVIGREMITDYAHQPYLQHPFRCCRRPSNQVDWSVMTRAVERSSDVNMTTCGRTNFTARGLLN